MNETVSIEVLKELSTSLKERKENISNIYNRDLYPIINECYSKMDPKYYEAKISAYNALYNSIITKLDKLCDLLNNGLIADYSELVEGTKKLFSEELNSKINELINSNEE